MCLGGLSNKSNCPNIPEGFALIRPGYTPLYRNRTNTMIDYSNPTLIFDDEFDGSTIDENRWDLHTDYLPFGYGFYHNIGMEYFSLPGDVTVSSGSAHLWAKYHPIAFERRAVDYIEDNVLDINGIPNKRLWHYSSGYLHSQQYFKHGIFEIRAKIPNLTNVWPGLWLYGAPGEIDILEMTRMGLQNSLENIFNANGRLFFTYHCNDWPISNYICNGKMVDGRVVHQLFDSPNNFWNRLTFNNTWHIFKLIWTENKMEWIVDDRYFIRYISIMLHKTVTSCSQCQVVPIFKPLKPQDLESIIIGLFRNAK